MCLVFVPIVSRETKAWKTKIISKEIYLRFGFQLTVFLAHHLITPHCLFWFIAPILKHMICPLCWRHAFSQLYTTLPPLLGIPFASVSIWQTHLTQYSHLSTVHLSVQCSVMPIYLSECLSFRASVLSILTFQLRCSCINQVSHTHL